MVEKVTDDNCDSESKLCDIAVNSYIRRPSIKDVAISAIGGFLSDAAYRSQKPRELSLYNMALLLIDKKQFRYLISGTSRVLHFKDGKIADESEKKEYPYIGVSPTYKAQAGPVKELDKQKHAFLLCSKSLTDYLSNSQLESTVKDVADSQQWLDNIEKLCGEFTDYDAQCFVVSEPKRKFPLLWVLLLAVLIAVIVTIVFLL